MHACVPGCGAMYVPVHRSISGMGFSQSVLVAKRPREAQLTQCMGVSLTPEGALAKVHRLG
jgi:hypothetical protein